MVRWASLIRRLALATPTSPVKWGRRLETRESSRYETRCTQPLHRNHRLRSESRHGRHHRTRRGALFDLPLTYCYLDPTILEALNFKRLGGLVPLHFERYEKLAAFSQRIDKVSSILKREKMDSLNQITIGTAVTNLTRMDFPRTYGTLELDRLIMNPGGAFPLATVNLALGAVTCSGKLSLVMEYAEEVVETGTMKEIRDKAIEFLLDR